LSRKKFRRRQESLPDDLAWLADPAGKDSCRRVQMICIFCKRICVRADGIVKKGFLIDADAGSRD
jgi:hypothetical protein